MSNYHGCKGEAINLAPHYLIDIHKTIAPSHSEKLKIIQNIYKLMFQVIFIFILAKILQNGARFIQKLTPGFKNHMRSLGNFRQAVESPKSWNLMWYFCPKNTFLQLKHFIKRIYLILLSTICMKVHQITFVISETISCISRFSWHNCSVFF